MWCITFCAITGLSGENADQAPTAMLVATSDQKDSGQNSTSDYKPKKGLLFEICSDDGFKVCCESIEGKFDLCYCSCIYVHSGLMLIFDVG